MLHHRRVSVSKPGLDCVQAEIRNGLTGQSLDSFCVTSEDITAVKSHSSWEEPSYPKLTLFSTHSVVARVMLDFCKPEFFQQRWQIHTEATA